MTTTQYLITCPVTGDTVATFTSEREALAWVRRSRRTFYVLATSR